MDVKISSVASKVKDNQLRYESDFDQWVFESTYNTVNLAIDYNNYFVDLTQEAHKYVRHGCEK